MATKYLYGEPSELSPAMKHDKRQAFLRMIVTELKAFEAGNPGTDIFDNTFEDHVTEYLNYLVEDGFIAKGEFKHHHQEDGVSLVILDVTLHPDDKGPTSIILKPE